MIENGQIYLRKPIPDDSFFPEKSWKVKIFGYDDGIVYHKIVEYDGEPRSKGQLFEMKDDDFLSVYELVS